MHLLGANLNRYSVPHGRMVRDGSGTYFDVDRAKTGRRALGTLGRRAERWLLAYLATFPAEPMTSAPIFRNRSGRAYSKDTLGDAFRDVRTLVFGHGETRQLADFRRSGKRRGAGRWCPAREAVEQDANLLSQSNRLHQTCAPVQLASVRDADEARKVGRAKLRERGPNKSVIAS